MCWRVRSKKNVVVVVVVVFFFLLQISSNRQYYVLHYYFAMAHNIDTEAPSVICPTNQMVATDPTKSTAMVVWTAPLATDNSKVMPAVTCSKQNGTQFEIGATKITCQALDRAWNQATCFFVVDVAGKCFFFFLFFFFFF